MDDLVMLASGTKMQATGGVAIVLAVVALVARHIEARAAAERILLEKASPAKAAELVGGEPAMLGISAKKARPENQHIYVLRILDAREKRSHQVFILMMLGILVTGIIAVVTVIRPGPIRDEVKTEPAPPSSDALKVLNALPSELRDRLQHHFPDQKKQVHFIEGLLRAQQNRQKAPLTTDALAPMVAEVVKEQIDAWIQANTNPRVSPPEVQPSSTDSPQQAKKRLLEIVAAKKRETAEALFRLAQMNLVELDFPAAHTRLLEAVKLQPNQGAFQHELGNAERYDGDQDAAREAYAQALRAYVVANDHNGQARLQLDIGKLELKARHFDSARAAYNAALLLYESTRDDLGRANAHLGLGHTNRQSKNYDQARAAYAIAKKLFIAAQDKSGQANVMRGLGHIDRHLGNYKEAQAEYDAAVQLCEEMDDRRCQANLSLALGRLARSSGQVAAAREYLAKAKSLYVILQNKGGQADVATTVGHLEVQERHYADAQSAYTEALQLYANSKPEEQTNVERRNRPSVGQANAERGLGDVALGSGKVEQGNDLRVQARTHYEASLQLCGESPVCQADAWSALARLEIELGNATNARDAYLKATKLYAGTGERADEAAALHGLGNVEKQLGNAVAARSAYDSAKLIYESMKDLARLSTVNLALAQLGNG
jgi:tetratricopeptide (TPR) repeat protein